MLAHSGAGSRPHRPVTPLYLRQPDAKPSGRQVPAGCSHDQSDCSQAREHPVGGPRSAPRTLRDCMPRCFDQAWDAASFCQLLEPSRLHRLRGTRWAAPGDGGLHPRPAGCRRGRDSHPRRSPRTGSASASGGGWSRPWAARPRRPTRAAVSGGCGQQRACAPALQAAGLRRRAGAARATMSARAPRPRTPSTCRSPSEAVARSVAVDGSGGRHL